MSGDGFPAAEMFIEDQSKQRLFVGVAPTEYGKHEGPFLNLFGTGTELMGDFVVNIILDENDNFQGILEYIWSEDSNSYIQNFVSIEDWNAIFENTSTSKENE